MLKNWLSIQQRNPCNYKFPVFDILESKPLDGDISKYLANELLLAHGNPQMIKDNCKKLFDDAMALNLVIVGQFVDISVIQTDWQRAEQIIIERYLEMDVFPAEVCEQEESQNGYATSTKGITRIGNFGEVLAAKYLVDFEDFWFPIYKLRLREKKDWAVRLTDLCLIKTCKKATPLICYGEVKTKTSKRFKKLAVKGHESLAKDDALNNPEILRYIQEILYETGKLEQARFIADIRLGRIKYSIRHDLYLIHEASTWSDEILEALDEIELDDKLVDFSVRVVLIQNLKDAIKQSYAGAWIAAKGMIDG